VVAAWSAFGEIDRGPTAIGTAWSIAVFHEAGMLTLNAVRSRSFGVNAGRLAVHL